MPKGNKQKPLSFVMPSDEVRNLQEYAKELDVSVSWVIRQSVKAMLAGKDEYRAA